MKRILERKSLQAKLQRIQMNQVALYIDLAMILTELSRIERDEGDTEAGTKNFLAASQAIAAARTGLDQIALSEGRTGFEAEIVELETALRLTQY